MATTASWYGLGLLALARGDIGLARDTIRATLHTGSYTPNLDTHDFFDDATNELPTASGYTAGGVTLAGLALYYDATSGQVRWRFTAPSWTFTTGVTFQRLVVRKARGGAASADELVGVVSWDVAQTVSGAWSPTLDASVDALLAIRRTLT